jgi:hypothetical protein
MGIRDAVEAATGETVAFDAIDGIEEAEAPAPPPTAAPGSVLDKLRASAAQLAKQQTIDLEIPGYNGVLVARYGAVSIARIYAQNPGELIPKWTVAADTLGRALIGLYGRNASGDPEPLQHDTPTRFDDDLVTMLNLHPTERSVRAVLIALCGAGDQELGESRLWAHYMQYQGWLMTGGDDGEAPAREVVDAIVGEFPGR